MVITRLRRVQTNETVLDQADILQGNGYDRVTGLTTSDLTVKVFWNNALQSSWVLADGATIPDALVVSGTVYWHGVPSAAGFYSVRWRPTGTGFWRIELAYATGSQRLILDYDVTPQPASPMETGLRASFSKP